MTEAPQKYRPVSSSAKACGKSSMFASCPFTILPFSSKFALQNAIKIVTSKKITFIVLQSLN
jgi:hypothetical protein